VAAALLVAHQNVAQLFGGKQGVVKRKDRTPWNAEDELGAQLLEAADDGFRACYPLHLFLL